VVAGDRRFSNRESLRPTGYIHRMTENNLSFQAEPMRSFYRCAAVVSLSCLVGQLYAADIRAVTEDGRAVVLSTNGRWKYDQTQISSSKKSPPYIYQSRMKIAKVMIDPVAWVPATPVAANEPSFRKVFTHRTKPIVGMVIADETPSSNSGLKAAIIANARNAGAEPVLVSESTKELGGKTVGSIRYSALLNGTEFFYSTDYFANQDGNVQITCLSSKIHFEKYESDCAMFIGSLRLDQE
jgi:hypothetical protein